LVLLLLFCLIGFLVVGGHPALAPTAYAQEEDGEKAKAADTGTKQPAKRSLFMHIVVSVGWVFGFVLLGVSIALLTLVVLLVMELRLASAVPPAFVEDFTETVNKRRFKEAYELAKEDGSYLARVMTAGMSRLQYGIEDARLAAAAMVDSLKAGKATLVSYLQTIGTLGPLLGLVGTVWGMILSFMTLSQSTGGVNAQKLADDISHALVVTLLGIGLSVPAISCHAFFHNRLVRLAHDIYNVADDLLTQMYHNSKKAGPAPAPESEASRGVATTAAVKPK
jgi:biopolymer transport protein ExbB